MNAIELSLKLVDIAQRSKDSEFRLVLRKASALLCEAFTCEAEGNTRLAKKLERAAVATLERGFMGRTFKPQKRPK